MPEVVIKFALPEEKEEFDIAMKAQSYAAFFDEVGREVFRPARKHGYPDKNIQDLITALDDLVEKHAGEDFPSHEYGTANATHLVGLLEDLYYRLMNEHELV